ncbi:hybrid sensor histidine kinase/response regulator [Caldithrix abyssi]
MIKKLFLLLMLGATLWAQEYPVHFYTIEEGLPSNEIYSIVQDSIGEMWISTRRGLCKYDGFHWQLDTTISKMGMYLPHFLELDDAGRVWVGGVHIGQGFCYLNKKTWHTISLPDSLALFSPLKTFKVIGSSDGHIFILAVTHKNQLAYFFQNQWKVIDLSRIDPESSKILTVSKNNNQFLILTDRRLLTFNGTDFKEFDFPPLFEKEKIISLQVLETPHSPAKMGRLLLLTPNYIYEYQAPEIIKKIPLNKQVKSLLADPPFQLIEDGFGGVFLGNKFRLFHFNNYLNKWVLIKHHRIPEPLDAIDLYLDQEKNLWIASYMGLLKIPTLRFLNFNEYSGLLETEVTSINQFGRGTMIFGHDNGFTLYDGKQFKKFAIGNVQAPSDRSRKRFMEFLKLTDDTIIAAAQQMGLVKIHQSGRYEIIPPPPGERINTVAKLNKKELLVGTYHGLFKFSNNAFYPYLHELTKHLIIRRMLLLADHTLLLATLNRGVVVIREDQKISEVWNHRHLKSKSVYDIKYSPQGKILVATAAGLFEFSQDSLIPVDKELINEEAYAILVDNENKIWIGTGRGVQIIDSIGNITHYDYFNGLAGQECNRDALFQDSSGRIWIGTIGGLSLYQPLYDFKVRPPLINFLDFISDIDFDLQPEKKGDLIIKFLCISFKDERQIALRYRLKGYHEWQYIPRLFAPVLSFLDVPPGDYQLEVQARNVEGAWSAVVQSATFHIPAPFYRSWYFIALVLFLISIITYLLVFARIKERLAQQLEAEVNARTKALKESEEKFRRLFTDSLDGIFITSIEGKILDINEAGIEILGYDSKDELLKLNVKKDLYANPEDREKILTLIKTQGGVKNYPLKAKRKDGKIIDVAISATPILDEQGNVVGLSGYFRDMTEWNAMKEQLAHSQRMESLGMLAGGVAHDFNNILAGILGYASLMKMKMDPDDKMFRYIDIIEKSAQRAADLTQQLLIFSRKGQPKLQPVQVNECVNETIKLIRSTFPKTIEIETELDEKLPEIMADPTQLSQMILNLCVNARDAMPDGEGKISFRTREVIVEHPEAYKNPDAREGHFVQLTIADTGSGIPDEIKNKIFEPFFTTKPRGKGTGMGLAMVYGFVRNLGGFIQFHSKLNEGTTFQIHFPVKPIHLEEKHLSHKSELKTGHGHILVVDDEEMVRNFCKMALERYGYTAETASNGQEALDCFTKNQNNFDLIILDMIMPVMDGMKTYQKIREINKEIKILISSGYSDSGKLEQLKKDPAVSIIFKPYKVDELVAKVQALTGQK